MSRDDHREAAPGAVTPQQATPRDATPILERRTELMASGSRDDPEMIELTAALAEILSSGTDLRRLRLGTSADEDALAARLLASEQVNPPGTPQEEQRRFAEDRRVFLLVHPRLANRPLAVVWVALGIGCPDTLGRILGADTPVIDPTTADTAVFYSIWTIEKGLRGLGVAGGLISGAADSLREELPRLSTLTTMSPIPGFRRWYDSQPTGGEDPEGTESLLVSCARYLIGDTDDHAGTGTQVRSPDPVARFHMGNGARLWRLLADADRSRSGLERSFGVMVNYRYAPENLVANKAALDAGELALGDRVADLLSGG